MPVAVLDLYYRPGVAKDMHLSSAVGVNAAAATAERIRRVKGWEGRQFYLNEWREMFALVRTPA